MLDQVTLDIVELDKALEVALLLRASESGYARDYRRGWAFGREEDRIRLDAFTVGLLDALAPAMGKHPYAFPLLVYSSVLVELGPGAVARNGWAQRLALAQHPEMQRYVAGGRRLVLRMVAERSVQPGLFAELLEQELQESSLQ